MSTIRTEVCILEDVRPHANADSLNLGTVKGWQMVLKKDERKTGDKVVYFEAGTVMPLELAEKLNVVNYLQNKTDIDGNKVLVVGRVKLRGEPSFGLVIPVEEALALMPEPETAVLFVGDDVSHLFGTRKFQPPVKTTAGDADEDHPHFPAYTDIENMRNFPAVFEEGEWVEATEKLHGTNCRVGYVVDGDMTAQELAWNENGEQDRVVYMAGSRSLRRKDPGTEARASNTYWLPLTKEPVQQLLDSLVKRGFRQAVLFGEVFGRGVQNYDYGTGAREFRAFDLMLDGKYVDRGSFISLCEEFGVEMVPVIYRGPYSLEAIKAVSDGDSVVGGTHGREGVVVRPASERTHPQIGRVILKYIGDTYLFSKKGGGAEDYTDQ